MLNLDIDYRIAQLNQVIEEVFKLCFQGEIRTHTITLLSGLRSQFDCLKYARLGVKAGQATANGKLLDYAEIYRLDDLYESALI